VSSGVAWVTIFQQAFHLWLILLTNYDKDNKGNDIMVILKGRNNKTNVVMASMEFKNINVMLILILTRINNDHNTWIQVGIHKAAELEQLRRELQVREYAINESE